MKKLALSSMLLVSIVLAACSPAPAPAEAKAPAVESMPAVTQVVPTQPQPPASAEKEVSFSRDIMPIFKQFADDNHSSSSKYSLESYEGTMKNVVPGNPEGSVLYQRLTGQGGPVMPPSGKLPDDLLKLIYDWIKQGAKNN
jgi:hypothetical protein